MSVNLGDWEMIRQSPKVGLSLGFAKYSLVCTLDVTKAVADTLPDIGGANLLFQLKSIVYFCCLQTKDHCSSQH